MLNRFIRQVAKRVTIILDKIITTQSRYQIISFAFKAQMSDFVFKLNKYLMSKNT
ncbi:hypothetical protein TetV_147 [Tetraselmis virus 1]|uniref:Uncharacterized protein n=1 Tax=Tetraselmis virus 1 TaxID=2060617 RepID=A0A2P0VNB5_9VIRU|nr:hypothetical protein QJ968_gp147 [Tetraselmis virus 1]AUF82239.1 hypothetical protein TetV_147 [Tetraselmis virus 1]